MGACWTARQPPSEGAALFGEAVRGDDPVDEAPGRKRLGWQDGGGEHHLGGAPGADPRRNALGPARVGDSAGHRLDLSDLTALGGPDEIAGKAELEGARVALTVDECEGRNRETLDRSDQREDGALQLHRLGLVKPDEDRDLRPCGEITALGSQQQGPDVTVSSLVDSGAQVDEEVPTEEIQWRAVDHDLAKLIVSSEGHKRHAKPQCPQYAG